MRMCTDGAGWCMFHQEVRGQGNQMVNEVKLLAGVQNERH